MHDKPFLLKWLNEGMKLRELLYISYKYSKLVLLTIYFVHVLHLRTDIKIRLTVFLRHLILLYNVIIYKIPIKCLYKEIPLLLTGKKKLHSIYL